MATERHQRVGSGELAPQQQGAHAVILARMRARVVDDQHERRAAAPQRRQHRQGPEMRHRAEDAVDPLADEKPVEPMRDQRQAQERESRRKLPAVGVDPVRRHAERAERLGSLALSGNREKDLEVGALPQRADHVARIGVSGAAPPQYQTRTRRRRSQASLTPRDPRPISPPRRRKARLRECRDRRRRARDRGPERGSSRLLTSTE